MIEKKFRVWDKKNKEMLYNISVRFNPVLGPHIDDPGFGCGCGQCVPDNYYDIEVMQFTGLTDKDGLEIYEGDIILKDAKVVWKDYDKGWDFGYFGIHNGKYNLSSYDCRDDFKVIGNIYENPELIEAEI